MKPLNDKNEWPTLAVYDIEATDWVNIVCIGHVDEIGNKRIFKTMEEYLTWLFSSEFKGTHVWAHWGGHYDHRFVIAHVTKQGWNWQTIQSGNLLIIIRVQDENGRSISFCESARLMPDSVAKIGKTVGLEKMDVDRENIGDVDLDIVYEYCLRDCEIILRGLQYMKKVFTNVGCDFAYTLASISTRWVRRSDVIDWFRFYEMADDGRFRYSKFQLDADEFCLPAYFGGRVEVFKKGIFKRKLYYYDITSSYPWSMTHELPLYFKGFFPPPKRNALDHVGISDATVLIPPGIFEIPPLPHRDNGKLLFPIGKFRGRWSNIELLELWKWGARRGVKIKIHGQARFEAKAFLKPFVDMFYGLRKQAKIDKDEFSTYAYKILLNSLYGKLVESIDRKSIVYGTDFVNECIERYGPKNVTATSVPGVYAVTNTSFGPFRHVAAGCYITALSRLKLLEGMNTCLHYGANVYYCDTDSIITDRPISAFKQSNELGSFKLEHTFIAAEFVSPKVYRALTTEGEYIYKVKGMPIKGLNDEEKRIRWDVYNEHNSEVSRKRLRRIHLSDEQKEFYGSKDGIAGFMTDLNKGQIAPRRQLLKRQLKHSDTKRKHSKDGTSKPIEL